MKKLVCLVLMVAMMLNVTAFAEGESSANDSRSFSLHGDVRFGMTIEEVTAIEAQQGFTRQGEGTKPYEFAGGAIARERKAKIEYGFDDDGKLFMMKYVFGPYDTWISKTKANYDTIELRTRLESGLIQKYGEPTAYTRSAGVFTLDKSGNPVITPVELYGVTINPRRKNNTAINSEWLREMDDGYIFIQITYHVVKHDDFHDDEEYEDITYCYFDKETFESFFNETYDDDL